MDWTEDGLDPDEVLAALAEWCDEHGIDFDDLTDEDFEQFITEVIEYVNDGYA